MSCFFFRDYTFSYCKKPSGMCLHIYLLPLFYCTWSKSHPLVDIRVCTLCKVHFHHSDFPRNTGLGTDTLFIKLELYCAGSKKKSIPDWHLFISQMKRKWAKWYAMTSHVFAHRSLELLFSMHTFYFNCFFDDFNCVFTQIRCLSRVLVKETSPWDISFTHLKLMFDRKKLITIIFGGYIFLCLPPFDWNFW